MLRFLVTLQVTNFDALQRFESEAALIMADHGARIVEAMEIENNPDGSGIEVHLLEFPDQQAFIAYRDDVRFAALRELRASAISATGIQTVLKDKTY